VENSLGRLWLESFKNSDLQKEWKYFIKQEMMEPEKKIVDPKEITVLDPAMGSGHILAYAFEVLYAIYRSQGYVDEEISTCILNNNLYGLEVDDRSAQLAGFVLLMKARQYDKNLFNKKIHLNLASIQETQSNPELDEKKYPNLSKLWNFFINAKNYGSILKTPDFNFEKIEEEFELFRKKISLQSFVLIEKIEQLIFQVKIMKKTYDCVITNPPYMGTKGMNDELKSFVNEEYPITKSDLFAVFIEKCLDFTKEKRFTSMITMQSWMFLTSFEKLRKKILTDHYIDTMVHLGPHAFDQIGGEVVSTTSFVLRK
jgi:type II restriction/modification system DNA methylase subunit YeeA